MRRTNLGPGKSLSIKRLGGQILKHWEIYVFILPALLYIIIFNYIPMYGVQMAFRDFAPARGIWGSKWVGLDNFRSFFGSFYFGRTIGNTIKLSLYSMIAGIPFPILLALMLNELRFNKYKRVVQTITYAPYFISTVVLVGMLLLFLNPNYGIFSKLFGFFGIPQTDMFNNVKAFPHVYVWSGIWQGTGFGSIIYLAVLSSVDVQLHEAAIVEGASRFQRILYINIPALMPTFVILLILNAGGMLNIGFEKVFLMQNPLNLEASEVVSTYVYKIGLRSTIPNMGLGTAVGLFNSTVNCILLIIVNKVSQKVSETSLW